MSTPTPRSSVGLVLRTFAAFGCFLLLSVIFWELAVGAGLLGRWARGNGWAIVGGSLKAIGIAIAALTSIATAIAFVAWIVVLVRVIRRQRVNDE